MAASFFSKKASLGEGLQGGPPNLLAVVRTMGDDLKEARRGKQKVPLPQVERQQAQDNVPQKGVSPFSKEGENTFQAQTKAVGGMPVNLLGVVPRPQNGFTSSRPVQPSLKNDSSGSVPNKGVPAASQTKKNNNVLWISTVGVLTIVLVSGGVFYYFFQRKQVDTPPSVSPSITQIVPKEVEESVPQVLPFALDKPNYLSFNTEAVSSEDIKATLSQAASRIVAAGMTQPVEFLVTDQNNNPLAFSRFAFLLKLDLDSELLALISETFSLSIYNDAGRARLGLALIFNDVPTATAIVAQAETTLPSAFQSLILEPNISVAENIFFHSSTYNSSSSALGETEFAVRYANVSDSQNVSFDYAQNGPQWFIGTSKNTLRAILDRYVK